MSQLKILNIINSLEAVVGATVGIFVPIYLLQSGFSLNQVFVYYLLHAAGIVPFFYLSARFCGRFGIRNALLVRLFFVGVFYLLLFALENHRSLFYLIPVVTSLGAGFLYYPMHFIFTENADHHEIGKRIATLEAWPQIVGVALPVISGVIAAFFGTKNLFVLAFASYLVSIFFYWKIREVRVKVNISVKKVLSFFRSYPRFIPISFIENWRGDLQGIVWPIFFFYTISQYGGIGEKVGLVSVGSINTIVALISIFLTYYIGRLSDKFDKIVLMKANFAVAAVFWFVAFFVDNVGLLYYLSIIFGLQGLMIGLPFQSYIYSLAKKDFKKEEFLIYCEIPQVIGRVALYAMILLLPQIKLSFLFSSVLFLFFLLI